MLLISTACLSLALATTGPIPTSTTDRDDWTLVF